MGRKPCNDTYSTTEVEIGVLSSILSSISREGEAMPNINKYKCSKCKFILSKGWGYSFYVENDKGKRIHCAHPGERGQVHKVLGDRAHSLAIIRERTGFNYYCICLDCLHQFEADLGEIKGHHRSPYEMRLEQANLPRPKQPKDKRECPECKSKNVKMELEMVGQPCPKCEEGVIEEIFTGARA